MRVAQHGGGQIPPTKSSRTTPTTSAAPGIDLRKRGSGSGQDHPRPAGTKSNCRAGAPASTGPHRLPQGQILTGNRRTFHARFPGGGMPELKLQG